MKKIVSESTGARRNGVTAVEFAMVAPIVFLFVFTIFELSRIMMLSGNVNTALLSGARHSTLDGSTPAEVEELIRSELRNFGISSAEINISPFELNTPVQIDVQVPVGTTFGVVFSDVNKSISIDRE